MAIPQHDLRLLYVKSGNRCAICRCVLTAPGSPPDREVVLGDVAHIVAESGGGPRGVSPLSPAERNRYENLVLLCTQHHQKVDAQPQMFTVERLRGIKEDHERWVERALRTASEDAREEPPVRTTDVVHSTLLPVEQMPRYVYGVTCPLTDERAVVSKLRPLRGREMAPFVLRAGKLFAFQDLFDQDGPFAELVSGQSIERNRCSDWWDDPDRMKWFVDLCNRALNKLTGRRELRLDRDHHRYYFQAAQPGTALEVPYRPLNQGTARRSVVWEPKNKRTGQGRGYWYHRAVSLRFWRIGQSAWCLSVRPELRVTVDGVTPLPARTIGGRVTSKKSRMFNYDLLGEVNFWRDYLSDSRPRIILPFGRGQQIVISTTLMQGTVTWPGIPEEHAKPFRNVEYADDLFTWAEFAQLDSDVGDGELTEGEEEEEDEEPDLDDE